MQRKHSARRPAAVLGRWSAALLSGWVLAAQAETLPMPTGGSDLVGENKYATARQEDTLIDIARRYSVGQDEIIMANPKVDRWLPKAGTRVLLPKRMILPDAPRAGIVVNIPEMRLYFYPVKYGPAKSRPVAAAPKAPAKPLKPGEKAAPAKPAPKPAPAAELGEPIGSAGEIVTYPISIGRMDWHTPLGKTRIVAKVKDPVWRPPESIKKEHAKDGEILPDVVPAGPDNPLGQFAMRLGVAGYLIHGVDRAKADGIGMRVTHGCVRMYPEDIEKLFGRVAVGTPVYMVNQPIKLGWDDDRLYMEVHQPLDEDSLSALELYNMAMELIDKKTAGRSVTVNREAVRKATAKPSGLPVQISGAGADVDLHEATGDRPESAPPRRSARPAPADAAEWTPTPRSTTAAPARRIPAPYTPEDAPDGAAPDSRAAPGASHYPYGAAPAAGAMDEEADATSRPLRYRTAAPRRPAPVDDIYAPLDSETTDPEPGDYGSSTNRRYPAPASADEGAAPAPRPSGRKPAVDPYEPAPEEPAESGYDPYAPYDSEDK